MAQTGSLLLYLSEHRVSRIDNMTCFARHSVLEINLEQHAECLKLCLMVCCYGGAVGFFWGVIIIAFEHESLF